MKIKNIFATIALGALSLMACQKNFNNQFEGLDEMTAITDVQTLEYTLVANDYSSIASNDTNKNLAGADTDVLDAIGSNKYFVSSEDAAKYIPAFIASSTTWRHLSAGSTMMVTYTRALDVPEQVVAMNNMKSYSLKADDYKKAWGSDDDYIEALTPATASKLASVISADGIEAGDYVAVTYKYAESEPVFSETDEPEAPAAVWVPVTAPATEGGKYLLVAEKEGKHYAFTALDASKTYGYPAGTQIEVSNGTIAGDAVTDALIVSFQPAANGTYTIQDNSGRYYYVSGTYNTFNVAATLDESGYTYTCTTNDDGTVTIKAENGRWLQQGDGTYTTWGVYDSQRGGNPVLYELQEPAGAASFELVSKPEGTDGKYVLVATKEGKDYAFTALDESKTYGYPAGTEIKVDGNKIAASDVDDKLVVSIKATTDGSFTIQDCYNKYYYVSGTYNSFNVAATLGESGYTYTCTTNDDGTVTIKAENGRWLQQGDGSYTTWGVYDSQRGGNPKVYRLNSGAATRAAVSTPASANMYAIYQYNGSAFTAVDAAVVQPSDYTEMGLAYGNFTNPDQDKYLPQFLAKKFPYAMADNVKYVVYRKYADQTTSWATDEYSFDGSEWTKTVYFEDKTDQFRKISSSEWKADPTLELNYLTDGTPEFKAFCQYCANWVYDNIDVPLGAPARDNAGVIIDAAGIKVNGANPAGTYFVSSYGNNEWYAGTYAYYGEMNWRADNARASFEAAGFTGLTDAEIVAKMQMNAAEVFQNVLHYMYPDVTPSDYSKVVINVFNYYKKEEIGAFSGVYSYSFNVVGKGEFEYIEDSFVRIK